MEFSKLIQTRASTKSYSDEMPASEKIEAVIAAGLRAPSGRNLQAPIIVAVKNKTVRDRLSAANAAIMGASADPFYNAPVVLVVLAKKAARTYVYDGSLAMGQMMLAAHNEGLGSCWIHRAREVFALPEWQTWLRSIGIEDEVEGVGNLVLGFPKENIPEPKSVVPNRVYYVE